MTAHTDDQDSTKDNEQLHQQQEAIEDLTKKLRQSEQAIEVCKNKIDALENDASKQTGQSEIGALQDMLATLTEKNDNFEDQLRKQQMSIILFGKVEASVDALKAQYEDKSVQPEYAHQWELEDLKEDLTKHIAQ